MPPSLASYYPIARMNNRAPAWKSGSRQAGWLTCLSPQGNHNTAQAPFARQLEQPATVNCQAIKWQIISLIPLWFGLVCAFKSKAMIVTSPNWVWAFERRNMEAGNQQFWPHVALIWIRNHERAMIRVSNNRQEEAYNEIYIIELPKCACYCGGGCCGCRCPSRSYHSSDWPLNLNWIFIVVRIYRSRAHDKRASIQLASLTALQCVFGALLFVSTAITDSFCNYRSRGHRWSSLEITGAW